MSISVAALVRHIDSVLSPAWSEPWDRVGLLVGDPSAVVEHVFVSLDVTAGTLKMAADAGAQALITHHPAFLEPPARLIGGPGPSGLAYAAAREGIALIAAHTNLDRSPQGGDCLARALGLTIERPLERDCAPVAVVVTYVPESGLERVLQAARDAGAGAVGRYEGCSFVTTGTGRFTPQAGSDPAIGTTGIPQQAGEMRVELVAGPDLADAVVAAIRSAHPYEEPVVTVTSSTLSRGSARLGRLCVAPASTTLRSLAGLVAARLGVAPRVWGDAESPVERVALAQGSGRSMVGDALAAGAQVMITGELGYHGALDAAACGLCVIEAGHDATEWPMVPYLASVVAGADGLDASCVHEDRPGTQWWTMEGC